MNCKKCPAMAIDREMHWRCVLGHDKTQNHCYQSTAKIYKRTREYMETSAAYKCGALRFPNYKEKTE